MADNPLSDPAGILPIEHPVTGGPVGAMGLTGSLAYPSENCFTDFERLGLHG